MPAQKPVVPSRLTPPEVIEKMYMQINNISQGFAIAILIDALADRFMNNAHMFSSDDFSTLLLAFTSLCISIIFWTRYYFDTFILKRSFSVRSIMWFFAYIVTEGFSFKQINEPFNWFVSTGIFLAFGFGFYALNLAEIQRKQKNKIKLNLPEKYSDTLNKYTLWQKFRLIDLFILTTLAFAGAALISAYSSLQYLIGAITLFIVLWQLAKSRDYKKFGFSNSHA
ncbi:MAG: hypothetical protein FD146_1066 [Anaerolineaceae bacterium]|nr:MAG: hypothetical protein FD146_1066 [Anaerolineaceae bacterium]